MTALSIVVPCFNEEPCLAELHERLGAAARTAVGDDYELVLVNDGSRDAAGRRCSGMAAEDPHVRRDQPVAQSRSPARADRRSRPLPRRHDPDHRRRPAGPARAAAGDAADDARAGRRRRLWRAQEPRRRDRVQARDGARLLPLAVARDRGRHPARCRRLPADEPARARRAAGDAGAGALHPRHGRVDRLPPGAVRLRPAASASPARPNIRCAR